LTPKREYDERDIRVRAKGSSRPRTKDRPEHQSAIEAKVVTVDRGRITCMIESGTLVMAMKARELGKNSVVVGDQVLLIGDTSGKTDSLARVVKVHNRRNSLTRTLDDAGSLSRTIAANVDQMIIVAAAADPIPRLGFIDRCLVVAFDQGITPVIVITKTDLASPEEFLSSYRNLDVEVRTTQRGGDLSSLQELLRDKISVFIGHSGVGKSTLVNALLGSKVRATGDVNEITGRGKHTSSSAISIALPEGGWVIDTPGVRSFGLDHIDPSRVIGSFPEFAAAIEGCPKRCSHNELACALDSYVESHQSLRERLASLRRLLTSEREPVA
jgi:ribosome biogenesis GTPase